jgi:tRNA(Leu) C34 or U34 (ribose-2'-O)-methylase TrmL
MAFNIVLLEPEIHTNTGNIGRLKKGFWIFDA